ncbi:hypothetical protein [Botrimarina sp.]|uniref:hypothetical protein n=1 Tax=Botrimarina sp. TaxID=2795802 RepID=UPI0032ED6EEA
MTDPSDPTPIPRDLATLQVAEAARASALAAGHRVEVECSPGSESTYVHVCRDSRWYGVRVSCHAPAYDCSIDYAQVLIEEPPTAESIAAAASRAEELAVRGGAVVADPADVAVAIAKIAAVMADGRVFRDADGTRWRWSSDDDAWRQIGRYWGDGPPTPPAHRPNPAVGARIRCQVRHAQNTSAKWAAEHEG